MKNERVFMYLLYTYSKYIYKVIVFHFFSSEDSSVHYLEVIQQHTKKKSQLEALQVLTVPPSIWFQRPPFFVKCTDAAVKRQPTLIKTYYIIALPIIPLQVKYNMYILLLLLMCSVYIQHPQRSMIVSVLIIDTIFFLAIHTIGTWSEN